MGSYPNRFNMGALFVGPETTFGVETASYGYVRGHVIDRSGLKVAATEQQFVRQKDAAYPKVIGAHNGTLKSVHELHGWSQESVLPSSAPSHWLAAILGSALGNVVSQGYTAPQSDSTATTLKATSLSTFVAGQAVAVQQTDTQIYRAAWLTGVNTTPSPDEGTLLQELPDVPEASTPIFGSVTAFTPSGLGQDPFHDGSTKSFTLKWNGRDAADCLLCLGCQPAGVKISAKHGEIPTIEIDWHVAHFIDVGSGGAPSIQAWPYPPPEKFLSAQLFRGPNMINPFRVASLEVDIRLDRKPIEDAQATSGIGGFYTVSRKPHVKFSVYRDPATHPVWFEAQTPYSYTFTWGSRAGRMVSICIPKGRIAEYPGWKDENGALASDITIDAQDYQGDTGTPADDSPINTDFRIALL